MLRCRADARKRFAAMRSDVLVKLELLDNKHVQDIVHQVKYEAPQIEILLLTGNTCCQLRRLMGNLTQFHLDCHKLFDGVKLFPIEMDLAKSAFQTSESFPQEFQDHVIQEGEEVQEMGDERILNLDTEESQGGLLRDASTAAAATGGSENMQLLSDIGPTRGNEPDTAQLLDL